MYIRLIKESAGVIKLLVIALLLVIIIPYNLSAETITKDRIYGRDRVETALKICDEEWESGAVTVVVAPANQENLIDALAAAPLAAQKNAPILLTYKNELDYRVRDKIVDLGASYIYTVGAISQEITKEIENLPQVVSASSLQGKDRWATAKQINDLLLEPAGSIVVGYNALADALSASSFAAANRYAIVLADSKGEVETNTLYGSSTIIMGNPEKISNISGSKRISGSDRYERNKQLLEELTYDYEQVYIVNGEENHLVDALVVAPLAAKQNSPIVLAETNRVRASEIVNACLPSDAQIVALGGDTVVPDSVRNLIYYSSPDLRVQSITSLSLNSVEILFTEEVDRESAESPQNYEINGKNLTRGEFAGSSVTLLDDEKTVLLMLYKPVKQNRQLEFLIEENAVESKDKKKRVLRYENEIYMHDNSEPKVESVEVSDDKQITVNFSEPVKIPSLEDCYEWLLDFSDLRERKLDSVIAPHNVHGYDNQIRLEFEVSLKAGLGKGTHRLTVMRGNTNGQLSDGANKIIEETEIEFQLE